jgi:hypothetical protein
LSVFFSISALFVNTFDWLARAFELRWSAHIFSLVISQISYPCNLREIDAYRSHDKRYLHKFPRWSNLWSRVVGEVGSNFRNRSSSVTFIDIGVRMLVRNQLCTIYSIVYCHYGGRFYFFYQKLMKNLRLHNNKLLLACLALSLCAKYWCHIEHVVSWWKNTRKSYERYRIFLNYYHNIIVYVNYQSDASLLMLHIVHLCTLAVDLLLFAIDSI